MCDYPHEGESNNSLIQSFDDLCDSTKIFEDGTKNILLLYKEVSEVVYLRWKESELKCHRLNIELTKQTDKVRLLENELAQSKSNFNSEVLLRTNVEAELEELKGEIQSLKHLQALSGHVTSSIRPDTFSTPVCQSSAGASISNRSRQSKRIRRPPLRYEDSDHSLFVNDNVGVLKGPRRSSLNELFEHKFVQVTSSKVENCVSCRKRIKFVKYRWKCDSCNISIHLECKANVSKCVLLCGFPTITRSK